MPDYDAPDLAHQVQVLSPEAINALPYGAIEIGPDGRVLRYSRKEAELSGRNDLLTEGLDFFRVVAPCMDTPLVRGRIEQARAAGTLNLRLRHTGDFADRGRTLEIRAQSSASGGIWLFNRRV